MSRSGTTSSCFLELVSCEKHQLLGVLPLCFGPLDFSMYLEKYIEKSNFVLIKQNFRFDKTKMGPKQHTYMYLKKKNSVSE